MATDTLLLALVLAAAVISVIVSLVALRRAGSGLGDVARSIRDELREGREESSSAARGLREEVAASLRAATESSGQTIGQVAQAQHLALDSMSKRIETLDQSNQQSLERVRVALSSGIRDLQEGNEKRLTEIRGTVDGRIKEFQEGSDKRLTEIRTALDGRVRELQVGNERILGEMRREAAEGLKSSADALSKLIDGMSATQRTQLEAMTKQLKEITDSNQAALDRIRSTLDDRVKELQASNEQKLEEMRRTVDDKLHDTLERRLGESFKLVSERLEAVHKGLGEMQTLATGVGDLKRVLTNVKVRGSWAEVQLGALLEQTLAPEQYAKNVCVKQGSAERVEFAIRLPGSKAEPDSHIWVPIDSKFPQEDYLRVQDAAERADPEAVQQAVEALLRAVRAAAKDIHDKYVNPPETTDFAVMFLATEGLYSEVLRQPGFAADIQTRYRVTIAGPSTLSAYLVSLRMGFQTLAIEKRASEVWRVLGAVKTEFGKFGDVLDKVKKQLGTAAKTLDDTGRRSRALERQLRTVEQLPDAEASQVLALPALDVVVEEEPVGPEVEVEIAAAAPNEESATV